MSLILITPIYYERYYRCCKRCLHGDCYYVTKWATITSVRTGQSPVQTVPARPVQIRAHHHIDVYTDINKKYVCITWLLTMK